MFVSGVCCSCHVTISVTQHLLENQLYDNQKIKPYGFGGSLELLSDTEGLRSLGLFTFFIDPPYKQREASSLKLPSI